MTKNILLTEIKRNDMGLDVEKLLCEYFSKEEVQDALQAIGEPTTGTKEELVEELNKNWESHNRDKYELLDFTEEDTLQDICDHYNLDDTPANNDVLKRRIKKANLLGSGGKPKPTAHVDRSHDSFITKPKITKEDNSQNPPVQINIGSITHSKGGKIGVAVGIASIIVTIIVALVV